MLRFYFTGFNFNLMEFELTAVGVDDENEASFSFNLEQNFPNPFNPSTIINYSIPTNRKSEMANTTLKIYDILGSEVATLVNEEQTPGNYHIEFDASNLSSGLYFYKLQSGEFSQSKKMILLR